MSNKFAWGSEETKYFFELTPEKILDSVERSGLRCTGRCLTLNSMENRVYEVEIEWESDTPPKTPAEKFRIVKFYRPGRWTETQILEEHSFLKDLVDAEIPAVAPLTFSDGRTLHKMPDLDIWYSVFPKVGGRNPDELTLDQAEQVGRLLGRMHVVGKTKPAPHRVKLDPETYGKQNLEFLISSKMIPQDYLARYQGLVEEVCHLSQPLFKAAEPQRIHGDCHLGNLLWSSQGAFFVDFDDMVTGPCIQDFWLLIPGRLEENRELFNKLITGYEQFTEFNDAEVRLVEPLRALRFIHFSAWIAKRWEDPFFKRVFTQFGTAQYWQGQISDLNDQLEIIRAI